MLLRGILLLSLILGTATATFAETPRVYYVKKGDTLWDISERFIKDPYFWPTLWSKNPEIPNPHQIYPGQKLLIYSDRIEVIPVAPEPPPMVEAVTVAPAPQVEAVEVVPPPPAPEPVEMIQIPQISTSFVTRGELDDSGTLIDTVDNRIMISSEDVVFIEMRDLGATLPGDKFTLFTVDKQVIHPATQLPVGFKVFNLGALEILTVEKDVATAKIIAVDREIERGARLRPYIEPLKEVELRIPEQQLTGYLLTSTNDRVTIGAHDVIYVDLGEDDGLVPGNTLNIFRPRTATGRGLQKEGTQLPDKQLGTAVVIEVRATTATALTLSASDYIENGDRVSTRSE